MQTQQELLAEVEALKKKLEVANNRVKTEKYGIATKKIRQWTYKVSNYKPV